MSPAEINAYLAIRNADSSCRLDKAGYCLESDGDNAHWMPMDDRGEFIDEDLCDAAIRDNLDSVLRTKEPTSDIVWVESSGEWAIERSRERLQFGLRTKTSALLAAHVLRLKLSQDLIKSMFVPPPQPSPSAPSAPPR